MIKTEKTEKPPKKAKDKPKRPKHRPKGSASADRHEQLIAAALNPATPSAYGEKELNEARLLSWQWAVEGGELTPTQWLRTRGYSDATIQNYYNALGGVEEFRKKRTQLQDNVTEKIAKRYVDKIAEMSESHLKSSNLIHLKSVEYLSKLSIEPARDKHGKILTDGKGKPVFRGIRSQDLLNAALAVKESQNIMRKALGISDRDEFGLAQILNKIEQKNEIHNTQVNITVNTEEKEISKAVEKLSYDDVVDIIKAKRRRMRELEAQKAKDEEGEGDS